MEQNPEKLIDYLTEPHVYEPDTNPKIREGQCRLCWKIPEEAAAWEKKKGKRMHVAPEEYQAEWSVWKEAWDIKMAEAEARRALEPRERWVPLEIPKAGTRPFDIPHQYKGEPKGRCVVCETLYTHSCHKGGDWGQWANPEAPPTAVEPEPDNVPGVDDPHWFNPQRGAPRLCIHCQKVRGGPGHKSHGGRPRGIEMPCGWGCGQGVTLAEMRDHFKMCPRRPGGGR